jgi:hypothetical protein
MGAHLEQRSDQQYGTYGSVCGCVGRIPADENTDAPAEGLLIALRATFLGVVEIECVDKVAEQ